MDKGLAMWRGKFLKDMTRPELYEAFDQLGKMEAKRREKIHNLEIEHLNDLAGIARKGGGDAA